MRSTIFLNGLIKLEFTLSSGGTVLVFAPPPKVYPSELWMDPGSDPLRPAERDAVILGLKNEFLPLERVFVDLFGRAP